jgi:hypothetical protein
MSTGLERLKDLVESERRMAVSAASLSARAVPAPAAADAGTH